VKKIENRSTFAEVMGK